MSYIGHGVEYGLHCLLWLVDRGAERASSRALAELQGVSPAFAAKIFAKLEKAAIVDSFEGPAGGYRLARPPERISVLDVVEAIEGRKRLFECQEIRGRCVLFGDTPPAWATDGVCAIHAVMLRAEERMRAELARTTLHALATTVSGKAPPGFGAEIQAWLGARGGRRRTAPPSLQPRKETSG